MKDLKALNRFFIKYKWRLIGGLLFVCLANVFAILAPVVVRNILDDVKDHTQSYYLLNHSATQTLFRNLIFQSVFYGGLVLLVLALIRGLFMFFMRQTIIVMSRHIEYDQKNQIFKQYTLLDAAFYKINFTGDLMNRISEDVSRVRMYTGPAIMYATNLLLLTGLCMYNMVRVNATLTFYVFLPLPFLAVSIFLVNKIIYKKSEKIQGELSDVTSIAQESYSGIRVIKSFVQEEDMKKLFQKRSRSYRSSAINLSLTESVYFPAMTFFIGLSMLSTVLIGGYYAIHGLITIGNIAEFVIYINMLMFPISSIGWVASMVQRAAASQKRINEFLDIRPDLQKGVGKTTDLKGEIEFRNVDFVYENTGIKALKNFSLHIQKGERIAIIGKTGSGKSSVAQLLLRLFDTTSGYILLDGQPIQDIDLDTLRTQIAYAPQEPVVFSQTIRENIIFGNEKATEADMLEAAAQADLDKDVLKMADGYDTIIGERGVLLSGGQKQRLILSRAFIRDSAIYILDESISAVDTETEKNILSRLDKKLKDKTTLVITHRISTNWNFDRIVYLEDGVITEMGTHEELMKLKGKYAKLFSHQHESS